MKLAILIFHLGFYSSSALAVDIAALVKQADEGRFPNKDISFLVSVKDQTGDKELRETRYIVKAKPPGYSLVETVFPTRQIGKKLLMRDDDLWFYTPDVRRPTRVSFQQRLTGEVSNGDISRTNFAGDYDAIYEGEETLDKQKTHRLLLKANRKSVTYQQIRYWVSATGDTVPVKAEFMTESGKLLKRATYKDVKPVLGRSRVTRILIEDGVQKAKKSLLEYSQFKAENFDVGMFNKDGLAE